jgi:NAD(P)-dependent dehydrogenase (short-subunit alcohol dehydrogenase family)
VSGAASGIGRACALLLAREGAHVVATDLNSEGCEQVAREIRAHNGRADWRKLDVTSERDWQEVMAEILTVGRLDVLVASAGISAAQPVDSMELEEWRRVMAINLDGCFLGIKHAVGAMRRGTGGSIILISSVAGLKAFAGNSAYGASKAGLRLLAKSAALECAQRGDNIRVNTVLPGGVETPMWRSMPFFQELVRQTGSEASAFQRLSEGPPLKRLAQPEEIASAVLYLASDESSYVTGSELVIDGGISA